MLSLTLSVSPADSRTRGSAKWTIDLLSQALIPGTFEATWPSALFCRASSPPCGKSDERKHIPVSPLPLSLRHPASTTRPGTRTHPLFASRNRTSGSHLTSPARAFVPTGRHLPKAEYRTHARQDGARARSACFLCCRGMVDAAVVLFFGMPRKVPAWESAGARLWWEEISVWLGNWRR